MPPAAQDAVSSALTAMPASGLPLVVGVVSLLLAGTGVVFSAYETLNHLAGVPLRSRFGFVTRYVRVIVMVVVVLAGGLGVAALTVASSALPDVGELQRVTAGLATAVVVFLVLVAAAVLLLARPATLRSPSSAAAAGAVVVALVLSAGARLLPALVLRAGPSTAASRRWRESSPCSTS